MAKILVKNEKVIFQNKINDYLRKSTEDYSRYFEGRPTFVTYYHKNDIRSSYEGTLDHAIEIIGELSGVRYNKIENFPLYNLPQLDLNLDETEFGLNTEMNGEGVVSPKVGMEPLVDDYFILDGLPERYLFRVTKVEQDKFSGKQFHKIAFNLEFFEEEKIEQQVVETYIAGYDDFDGMLTKADKLILEELNLITENLQDYAIKYFYNEQLNFFFMRLNDNKSFYDAYWTKFSKENRLFIRPEMKSSINNIYLEELDITQGTQTIIFDSGYKHTIFYYILNKNPDLYKFNSMYIMTNTNQANELSYEGLNYLIGMHAENREFKYFKDDFKSRVLENNLYPATDENSIENFIIKFMNNKIDKNNISEEASLIDLNYDLKTFMAIPLILKIIDEIRNKLIINN